MADGGSAGYSHIEKIRFDGSRKEVNNHAVNDDNNGSDRSGSFAVARQPHPHARDDQIDLERGCSNCGRALVAEYFRAL
jgi:hypothetical protein